MSEKKSCYCVTASFNNATVNVDGTKTAYCDYGCGTTNTIIDEGSALEVEKPDKEKHI